ncbi:MAG: hypothetical protein Q9204_002722 [Flavoplaca sp. TL-2023a]
MTMEPVSIAASLLAVLEATAAVCKSITALYRNVREAPKELAHLCTQISQTQVRLNIQIRLHENLKNSNIGTLLPDEALQTLQTDLKDAEVSLESVRNMISATSGYCNSKQRFGWVIQDKRKVTKLLGNLWDIDNNLSAMLHTMSLYEFHPLKIDCLSMD